MKILRIIARLNVGGPARHVVWLTSGLKSAGCETLLVAGVVPPGEEDMSYFAEAAGVKPLIIAEMSREISPRDLATHLSNDLRFDAGSFSKVAHVLLDRKSVV